MLDRAEIEKLLNEEIAPQLAAHGGGIQLVDVDEPAGVVKVQLQGGCAGCPGARMTLKNGVERILKEQFPEVTAVEAV